MGILQSNPIDMEMTDVTAVSRARDGDADAFRFLVERHSRAIFRVAYRMTANDMMPMTWFRRHDRDDEAPSAKVPEGRMRGATE